MSRSSSGSEASLENSQEADSFLSQISLVESAWGPRHRQGVRAPGSGGRWLSCAVDGPRGNPAFAAWLREAWF